MEYYTDIKLLGDTEVSLGFIWQKIYTQMHLALAEHQEREKMSKIGFAFPNYMQKFPLGDTLRVLASAEDELEVLHVKERLKNFLDYVTISDIKKVPTDIKGYMTFYRKQFKSNPERLAKRYAKRHNITLEKALSIYENMKAQETKLPFVMLKSNSSNQHMKLFIERCPSDTEVKGLFNTYGLSKTSTVPIF
jgi:CRISPR-associated endonuclease Csy4